MAYWPRIFSTGKKQFLENASLAFDPAKAVKDYKDEIEKLKSQNSEYAKKVGQLTLERDFLEGKLVSSVSSSDRRGMIETGHDLPILRQCALLHITRSTHYYKPVPVRDTMPILMRRIDEIYTERSTLGYRQIYSKLQKEGFTTGINRVWRLMNRMGLRAVFPKKDDSKLSKRPIKRLISICSWNFTMTKNRSSPPTPIRFKAAISPISR